jgi:ribosomal-protein-alanine acetyltransferase
MTAVLRPAQGSDVDALEAIEAEVFSADRIARRSFQRFLASPSADLIVADVDGRILGYCCILSRKGLDSGRLYSIATLPGHEGAGMGRRLLGAAEAAAAARGLATLRLEVRADNARAIALYERSGYRRAGRRDDYYADGTAALLYVKPFDEAGQAGGTNA